MTLVARRLTGFGLLRAAVIDYAFALSSEAEVGIHYHCWHQQHDAQDTSNFLISRIFLAHVLD